MSLLLISFLWNWSSCKMVSLLRDPLTGQCSPSSKGYRGHSVSKKKIRHVFLNSGDQTCPSFFFFFLIHFKGVVLELLAPIYKGEKRSIHSCGFFVTEESFPALDGGVDKLSTEAVHLWSDLVCPLPTQAFYSFLLVLPPRPGGDAPGVHSR